MFTKSLKKYEKCINLKRFLHMFCTHLQKGKLPTKKPLFACFFFKFVTRKCLTTHAKYNQFKTFFSPSFPCIYQSDNNSKTPLLARFLDAFYNVKIVHENVGFCMFLFYILSPLRVSKRMQNAFIPKRF